MSFPPHIKAYIDCLSKRNQGTPLWSPTPVSEVNSAVETPITVMVGDVGRIRPIDGSWDRFFNVLDPAGQAPGGHYNPPDTAKERKTVNHQGLSPNVYSEIAYADGGPAVTLSIKPMYVNTP